MIHRQQVFRVSYLPAAQATLLRDSWTPLGALGGCAVARGTACCTTTTCSGPCYRLRLTSRLATQAADQRAQDRRSCIRL